MSNSEKAIDVEDDDDFDDEQLNEYEEMVQQLGVFPDKVKINSLSMVAEDHADSKMGAKAIYNCIRKPLMATGMERGRKLPLVYVIDSILKNVKGQFIPIIEEDAKNWMPLVYDVISDEQRAKLKKVWNTWREFGIFKETSWKEMGSCFTNAGIARLAAGVNQSSGGISRSADGTLQLSRSLRNQMQQLLDEAQSTVENELDKVSLERLADIDPTLLMNLKREAETLLSSKAGVSSEQSNGMHAMQQDSNPPAFFLETRPPMLMEISQDWVKEWEKPVLKQMDIQGLVQGLKDFTSTFSSKNALYTKVEASQMTCTLAAAAVVSASLVNGLDCVKKLEASSSVVSHVSSLATSGQRLFHSVDKGLFTSEGVKVKNSTFVDSLYEVGLPFVSSSDGRRFASQIDLSKHLDYLFKKNQLEKSMERTDERGWYMVDVVWTGELSESEISNKLKAAQQACSLPFDESTDSSDPMQHTVPADESRDKCAICNINFKMVFDNSDGIYKYSNCREIDVLNDDAAEQESESVLVHNTCWMGLGSPNVLTMDQVL